VILPYHRNSILLFEVTQIAPCQAGVGTVCRPVGMAGKSPTALGVEYICAAKRIRLGNRRLYATINRAENECNHCYLGGNKRSYRKHSLQNTIMTVSFVR
jgi:hypothetical protein